MAYTLSPRPSGGVTVKPSDFKSAVALSARARMARALLLIAACLVLCDLWFWSSWLHCCVASSERCSRSITPSYTHPCTRASVMDGRQSEGQALSLAQSTTDSEGTTASAPQSSTDSYELTEDQLPDRDSDNSSAPSSHSRTPDTSRSCADRP